MNVIANYIRMKHFKLTAFALVYGLSLTFSFSFAQRKITLIKADDSKSHSLDKILINFQEELSRSLGYPPDIIISNSNNNGIDAIILGKNYKGLENVDYSELGADGFVIQNQKTNQVVISAATDWGIELGTYYFLENFLNVRWLFPSDIWINQPVISDFKIPKVNTVQKPDYITRRLAPINPEDDDEMGRWGRHLGLRKDVEYGHNVFKIFGDTKKYAPIVQGKRVIPKTKNDQAWQPNFNEEGAVDYASKYIRSYFQKHPNLTSISLGINDSKIFDDRYGSGKRNHLGFLDYSHSYYSWVRGTVEQVNRMFTSKKYGLLAYNNVAAPPSFKLPDNVVPFITFEKLRWVDPKFRAMDLEILDKWGKVANEIGWYDYIYGASYIVPRPYFNLISDYLKVGKQSNVLHYTSELYSNTLEGPKAWIVSKLLWNTGLDVNLLLTQWCEEAFGQQAGKDVRDFYLLWDSFWTSDIINTDWFRFRGVVYLPFNNSAYINSIPAEYMERSDQLLKRALAKTSNEIHKDRIMQLLETWELSKMIFVYFNEIGLSHLPKSKVTKKVIFDKMDAMSKTQLNERFISFLTKYYTY